MSEFFGHGECDHEMVSRNLPIHLFTQPLSGFMMLAIGAMTIAAAAVNYMVFAALGALIDRSAIMPRAAVDDGVDDLAMISRHAVAEALNILGAILAEYVFNRCHDHLLSSAR